MSYSEGDDFKQKDEVFFQFRRFFATHNFSQKFERASVLEVGGAGGILGGLISNYSNRIIVTDIVDVQVQYEGQFPRLLKQKFERNGYQLDLSKIEFQVVDAMNMPYRDGIFDIVVSNNAFEHIPDPFKALREVLRVLKPGGVAYLTFDPIWTADTGNHFSHYIREPWAHLLCGTEEFAIKMREAGAAEWEVSDFIHGMNRIHYREYKEKINHILESANLHEFFVHHWSGCVEDQSLKHQNWMDAAKKFKCDPNDLLVRGFNVIAVK